MPRLAALTLLALAIAGAGCWLPKGSPVYIDGRYEKLWSGNGVLIEVSDDGLWCRVAARNRALVVEKKWVECKAVHRRFRAHL
jgi:hypothetical protein